MTRQLTAPLRLVPMTLIMGAIFILSHQPGDSLQLPPLPGIDKLAHLLIYGMLAAATLFAFSEQRKKSNCGRVVFITTVFCFLYGVSDEIHQSFVPGRFPSSFDILADCCGAVLVCLLWLRYREETRAR